MADYVSNYSGDQIDEAVSRAFGFGLGDVQGKTINSLEEITGYGFFRIPSESGIAPDTSSNWGAIYVGSNLKYGTLIASRNKQGLVFKTVEAGVWGEWEWLNPPMQLGVEYRTTERYLGKPVYVCVKEFTGLTNGANFSTGITNGSIMVRYHAKWTSVLLPFINQQDLKNSWSIYLNASNVNIMSLWYGADTFDTTPTLTVTMYYTKSTD